jgi:hypothetical protein
MIRNQVLRWLAIPLAVLAVLAASLTISSPKASANTTSNWSGSVRGTSITYGWTNDHAWVISDYRDAIIYGAGFISSLVCNAAAGESWTGIGSICNSQVRGIVASLIANKGYVTNHGIWDAFYVYPLHNVIGTY